MELLSRETEKNILGRIIPSLQERKYTEACESVNQVIKQLYNAIPENKRISYGIVHTVKLLGEYLYHHLEKTGDSVFDTAFALFKKAAEAECRTVSLCIISLHGLKEPEKVFPVFREAAADEDWQVREITQMLFRKIIKKHPEAAGKFLLKLVKSNDPLIRRFVGETLRPVCENKWFYKQPQYSLKIIKHLFRETKVYPRTSVGNNLSDLSRNLPELVIDIVKDLVERGDKNSYWIAYRACRNLVKKEPERIMRLLKTDIYKYKDRIHYAGKTKVKR